MVECLTGDEPHRRHCVVVLEQDTFILQCVFLEVLLRTYTEKCSDYVSHFINNELCTFKQCMLSRSNYFQKGPFISFR